MVILSLSCTYLRASDFCCAYRNCRFLNLQSGAQIPVVRLEQTAGRFIVTLNQVSHDAHGALAQFSARGMQIDHEIAADFAKSNHCARADDVERDLRRGPGFQSGRSSQDLRSD